MRPPNRFCSSLFSHVAVAKNISLESTSTGREEERGARKEETTMMTTMTAIFGFSDRVIRVRDATEAERGRNYK